VCRGVVDDVSHTDLISCMRNMKTRGVLVNLRCGRRTIGRVHDPPPSKREGLSVSETRIRGFDSDWRTAALERRVAVVEGSGGGVRGGAM
jgi:hypothetical protein